MMGIGLQELIIILIVAFLIFGARRLPELGSGLGKAIRSFNKRIKGEDQSQSSTESKDNKDKIES